ncbi:MAG: chorismate mutase [Alphaproteobacteria bacterium]|nr:chorismate mutase [Alphaproteobacteria bacterium]
MSQPTLDQIRREIDAVDDAIHDLLMRRAELGEQVVAAKNGAAPGAPRLRPAREAAILRRLRARHAGALPFPVVGHIWREVITSFLNRQSPVEVAVWGGACRMAVWDAARTYFGVTTRFAPMPDAAAALARVASTAGGIGVLAFEPGGEPWWRLLADADGPGAGLQIFARLPFFMANDASVTAFAVAPVREDSGDETTLAVLHGAGGNEASGPGQVLARHAGTALVALPGFLSAGDPALERARAAHGAERATVIGGYANPIDAPLSEG